MSSLHTSAAPHINSGATTHKVMRDVVIALLPATVAGNNAIATSRITL